MQRQLISTPLISTARTSPFITSNCPTLTATASRAFLCPSHATIISYFGGCFETLPLENINDLPISYDIAWYEQKAVAVLLALLYLGVKGIRLGPTLPAFLSPNVVKVLVDKFDIKSIGTVEDDMKAMLG